MWCYITLAVLSYIHWFDQTGHIVFFNFNKSYIYMFFLEIIYATSIFFSNPINLFPIYESIYKFKGVEEKIGKLTKGK